MFGLLGYNGRVGFGDATPANASAVEAAIEKVPVPWTPDASKTRGDFRLYDLDEAKLFAPGRPTGEKRPKELSPGEVYRGAFETRMTFVNLEPQELGRLLLAMGIGSGATTTFHLRVGGVKYDGKGAVEAAPRRLRLTKPKAAELSDAACREQCIAWIAAARGSRWADVFWPKLEEVAAALGPKP